MKFLWNKIIHSAEVAQNATAYSSSVPFSRATGELALKIVSSAGSVTITQQCSMDDGISWQDPEDVSGNALGAVVTTMTVGTKYVVPSAVVAPLIRYKIVENNTAASTVVLELCFQEEN